MSHLARQPTDIVEGCLASARFSLRVGIPNYAARIEAHYRELLSAPIAMACESLRQPFKFPNFGLICEFREPCELNVYQGDVLCDGLRDATERFGPVLLSNAFLSKAIRGESQRGRFQDLNFHIDRSQNQETQYSLYSRDPNDPAQREPRTASTLFIPNAVALLQDAQERQLRLQPTEIMPTHHTLFKNEEVRSLVRNVIREQDWSAPPGTGEMAVQFNPHIRHASWYRGLSKKGWHIGVRYLR